ALLIQRLFDRVLPTKSEFNLLMILGGVLLLFIINAIAILWNRHLTLRAIKSAIFALRQDLLKQAIFAPYQFYADTDLDHLHAKIVHDTERVDCLTSALLTQFLPGMLIFFGLSVLLIYLNPLLFLIVCIVMPFIFATGKIISRRVKAAAKIF